MKEEKSAIKDFAEEYPGQEFRPVAYYDKHLDCIRVQIKDCSFWEERINDVFTLWFENHTDDAACIGFTIKGIKYLFMEKGLTKEEPVHVANIMDAVLKEHPDQRISSVIKEITQIFFDFLDLEVDEVDDAYEAA